MSAELEVVVEAALVQVFAGQYSLVFAFGLLKSPRLQTPSGLDQLF
jgi:hypothetical protein